HTLHPPLPPLFPYTTLFRSTTAKVISAHPLTSDQVKELKQQLRTRIGRDVSVDLSVDPSLLGGLVVKIGSQMIDSSIKTRLNSRSEEHTSELQSRENLVCRL